MGIYTRTGDTGETAAHAGRRVRKDDSLVEAYGSLDELNSFLGLALAFSPSKGTQAILKKVQKGIFDIGASIFSGEVPVGEADVKTLEKDIDVVEERLKPLKHFIIPGGVKEAALLHCARTICRRAERRLVSAKADKMLIKYLNRLSDLLFVLARLENAKQGMGEEIWKKGKI
ncbi:MAG: cob(I)yrinic acid a,c-diamide adenosyltransferase [Candidatus ainarchaeum sp.]|nr:cob(I)yrinic acid a,c-diamide adenosyltransferase [Candidatus ainarchaeum sp.]MDD5096516.1 cob(I)yrinic acid a,c-diamide adenosyltransferase [Candidatus ainarchaeum sp.]